MPARPSPPPVDPMQEDVVDLTELMRALWRQKLLIGLITAVFVLLGGYYAQVIATPKYRATTVLLLDTSGQKIVDLGISLPNLGSDSRAINTEVEVLHSRELLQRVAIAANLAEDPEFNSALRVPGLKARLMGMLRGEGGAVDTAEREMERVVNALIKALTARNLPKTEVLQITLETEDPVKSAALADLVAQEYILYQMDVKFEATRSASQWLSGRVADLKLDLEQAEARLASYSTQSDVVSKENVQALERQLKELRSRLDTAERVKTAAQDKANGLTSLTTAPDAVKAKSINDSRLAEIYKTSGASPEFDTRFTMLLNRAQLEARRAQSQAEALRDSISTLETQIAAQSDELIELQHLSRDAEASRLLYEYFLSRLKENAAQEGLQQADSRILSHAVIPTAPSEPRKSLILVLSAFLGLIAGSGTALAREAMQNTYRTAAELEEATGIAVMGQIPLLPAMDRQGSLTYLADKPMSAAAEAIRNLRTSVLLSRLDAPPRVIMTTSSVPNEGKTLISFALAQNLVGMGKKVLLVEGDIRRLVFSQYLDTETGKGLLSVLSNEVSLADAVLHSSVLGCDVLPGDPSNVNAADILSSNSFDAFLETAKSAYDVVIIDTPPVLVVPDARILAPKTDMVLFTVQWDKTKTRQVADALRLFSVAGQKVDGLVLNQIDGTQMKHYGYGDTYGSYGGTYYAN
ncbi:polysaccharide biosynthesis tyrosine autokinase [Aliiroseovarius crassostreae]|uniref:polysaccharide biosynthesis tyrosine autokinase n=1 Tax=Aliiroseovarius crassostreae TaxID=154981 RepID=UPI003C7B0A36